MDKKQVITPSNLGKGWLKNVVTTLFDVFLSADSGNLLSYGSDNGLYTKPLASDINYDNTDSNLTSSNVKEAIDELKSELPDTTESPIATTNDAVSITEGLQGALVDGMLASEGNVGKTTFFVQAVDVNGGICEVACLETGLLFINDVFIKAMTTREVYKYSAQIGDKIIMKGGGMNAVNDSSSIANTPIEVNNTANAAKEFFWNRFREANGDEFTTATLPVETNIKVYGPNPTFIDGEITGTPQHDINIPGGQTVAYVTVGVGEYYMRASQPVIHSTTNRHTSGSADPRAINPPVRKLIGHCRSGGGNNYSSLRDNNNITIYQRSGEIGNFTASPGSPAKIDVGIGGNADYDPNDIGIADATGEGCAYAGADAGGRNATQWQDTRSASNNFVLTLDMGFAASNDDRGSLYGEFECEWFVFMPDGSYLGSLDMRRGSGSGSASPATTKEHQRHPAALTVQPNQGIFAGLTPIPAGTQFISNMPAFMNTNYTVSIPGQVTATEDETTVFGTVLPEYLCQTRKRLDGLGERLVLDESTGESNWVPY